MDMQTQAICFQATVNLVSSELNIKRAVVTKNGNIKLLSFTYQSMQQYFNVI